MKKNLKKVISAVIALALSVSSVAMAAPTFTDVADTASYAQAVDTLAALGVISGYEDGSFKPDNNITRAEVATMMVAALNRSADAEGSKGTTKFADMNTEAKAWATGFVNIGVSEGFISGYEDGSFQPDNNVTYAEAVSMLVRIAGYGRYAEYLGGWPNGFLSVGSQYGITKGVSASENTAVTRAQVAQLIYNTLMDTPIVESTTLTTDKNGNLVPDLTIMNGKNGNDWKTLLTEKHNAYYVEGKVVNTNKSTGGRLDADEVDFQIEYTENYNDSETVIKKGETVKNTAGHDVAKVQKVSDVNVGDTAAADYIMTYASAIIKIDDNDDTSFVYFAPSGKNDISTFATTLIDDDDYKTGADGANTVYAGGAMKSKAYVKYYPTKDASKSTEKIYLSTGVQLYVNGVEIENFTQADFEKYVVNNTVGEVQYIDTYKTDGDIDYIFVTYYATAQVDQVTPSNGRIGFTSEGLKGALGSRLVLDPDDDDLSYSIEYNGEDIDVSALQKDDVLSIAYNVTGNFADSKFYDIHVSRDTAEGKYTQKYDTDKMVLVGGTKYETVDTYSSVIADTSFKMGDEYTIYLDAFGRIFKYETLASSARYAIIDKYTKASSDDYYRATLFLADGTVKAYEVDTTRVTSLNLTVERNASGAVKEDANGKQKLVANTETNVNTAIKKLVYLDNNYDTKTDSEMRVVKYKLSSKGQIISLEVCQPDDSTRANDEFDSYDNTLGSIRFSDATKIVNAIDYQEDIDNGNVGKNSDISLASINGFVNKTKYTAYAYGDTNSDGSYPFVLVTAGAGTFTAETALAVVYEYTGKGVDADDEDIYGITVLVNGEKKELNINDDAKVGSGVINETTAFEKGDVVVLAFENDTNVKEIQVVATAASIGLSNYNTVVANGLSNSVSLNMPQNWSTNWDADKNDDDKAVVVYGPVIDKTSSSFRVAKVDAAKKTNIADREYYDIKTNDNTKVYLWDYNQSTKNQLLDDNAGLGAIANSYIDATAYSNNKTLIDWSDTTKVNPNFVLVKTVNGYATEVFMIQYK